MILSLILNHKIFFFFCKLWGVNEPNINDALWSVITNSNKCLKMLINKHTDRHSPAGEAHARREPV